MILDAVREVAISKLCSALEIGPAIETRIPFDLVAYENAIQFHLERCFSIRMVNEILKQRLAQDLKDCLAVLHSLNIVHKDIKPANVLWSTRLMKFVLCDFGISHFVAEVPGQQSETYREGTPGYMCPELDRLRANKVGYVDLYYNDAFGLCKAL